MNQPNSVLPSFHDGFLDGFLARGDEVRVFVRAYQGAPFTLMLMGVKRFNVEGFAEGNIILECGMSTNPEVPMDILIALNHGGKRHQELAQLRALIADEGYQVLSIVPSYGATVVALVKELSVIEGTVMY